MSDSKTPFNRWLIRGSLKTLSPLHVGTGELVTRADVLAEQGKPATQIQFSPVFVDHAQKPCIPGASLKGILRSRLMDSFGWNDQIERLFGSRTQDEGHIGGVLNFYDARLIQAATPRNPPPFWDRQRGTGIVASVALVRRTRTARDEKLFHHEFVPLGATFGVRITGQGLSEADVALVLWALQQFGGPASPEPRLRLGRNTANGWGTFDWSPETPQRLDTDAVRKWVAAKDRKAGWSALEPLDQASMTTVKAATDRIQQPSSATRITIRLTLHFDGPLLVREGGAKPPAGSEAPIVGRFTTDGRVLLPARSIRGAFRAQGERILRTLAPDLETADKWAPDPTRRDAEEFAATEPRESDDALALRLHSLPLAARIFGVGGWRSAVEFSDFTTGAGVPVRRLRQQCVAIDRFTGGAADGALFGLEGVWQPILEGTMTLDRSRWARAGVADWGPGLIALVLCDLRDGFLTFGMGASKGYGACRGIWDAKNLNLSSDIERLRASLPRPAAPRFIIT